MKKETFITEWHISEYEGRRSGDVVLFQGKKLSQCKKLRAWIRWDKYLIRYYDILWFAGYEGSEFLLKPISELKAMLDNYIKDYPILKLINDAENFTKDFRHRWFYAKIHGISKAELGIISDDTIYKYFETDNY